MANCLFKVSKSCFRRLQYFVFDVHKLNSAIAVGFLASGKNFLPQQLHVKKFRCSQNINTVKIYTRTGDKGKSSLYTGERQVKDSKIFAALGAVDELSAHIGLSKELAFKNKHKYVEQLERIQCILQDIQSILASSHRQDQQDVHRDEKLKTVSFTSHHVRDLEQWIDDYMPDLPPLTNFILPGGGYISATLHVTRTVCRRAEREVVSLSSERVIDSQILAYINRLSDYLFTVARVASKEDGCNETIYMRPHSAKSAGKLKNTDESQKIVEWPS